MLITLQNNPILFNKIKNETINLINAALSLYKVTEQLRADLCKKITKIKEELKQIDSFQESPKILQEKIQRFEGFLRAIDGGQSRLKKVIIGLNNNTKFVDEYNKFDRNSRYDFFKNQEFHYTNIKCLMEYYKGEIELKDFNEKQDSAYEAQENYRQAINTRKINLIDNFKYLKPILIFAAIACWGVSVFLPIHVALGLGGTIGLIVGGALAAGLIGILATHGGEWICKYGYQDYINSDEPFIPQDKIDEEMSSSIALA